MTSTRPTQRDESAKLIRSLVGTILIENTLIGIVNRFDHDRYALFAVLVYFAFTVAFAGAVGWRLVGIRQGRYHTRLKAAPMRYMIATTVIMIYGMHAVIWLLNSLVIGSWPDGGAILSIVVIVTVFSLFGVTLGVRLAEIRS